MTCSVIQSTDNLFGSALVKAPLLLRGTLEEAIQREAMSQNLINIRLVLPVEQNSNVRGAHMTTARTGNPNTTAVLAHMMGQALLGWNIERAVDNVKLAQQGLDVHFKGLHWQLQATKQTYSERNTLLSRRSSAFENLTQVNVLEQSTMGVLLLLSTNLPALEAVIPNPSKDFVLAGLLGLAIAAIIAVSGHRIRSKDDLFELGLPILNILSAVSRREVLSNGVLKASRQAGVDEAISFLGVQLMTFLGKRANPVLMVNSSGSRDGKSSMSVTLAGGLASSMQSVIIVDADSRLATQCETWQKCCVEKLAPVQLIREGNARITRSVLSKLQDVIFLQVVEKIGLLSSAAGTHNSLSNLTHGKFDIAVRKWRSFYDIVLTDILQF